MKRLCTVSSFRMKHKSLGMGTFLISFFECCHYQINIRFWRDVPGDNFAGKQVHYNAEVVPFTGDFYIGEIASPDDVWTFLVKLLLQMIGTFTIFFMTIITERFIRRHTWQPKSFHQTVHSTDTDENVIITLKNIGNFVSTKTLVVISINLQDKPGCFLIFFSAISWL